MAIALNKQSLRDQILAAFEEQRGCGIGLAKDERKVITFDGLAIVGALIITNGQVGWTYEWADSVELNLTNRK